MENQQQKQGLHLFQALKGGAQYPQEETSLSHTPTFRSKDAICIHLPFNLDKKVPINPRHHEMGPRAAAGRHGQMQTDLVPKLSVLGLGLPVMCFLTTV